MDCCGSGMDKGSGGYLAGVGEGQWGVFLPPVARRDKCEIGHLQTAR